MSSDNLQVLNFVFQLFQSFAFMDVVILVFNVYFGASK